jgi:P-type conjugative transfer protein TrbL
MLQNAMRGRIISALIFWGMLFCLPQPGFAQAPPDSPGSALSSAGQIPGAESWACKIYVYTSNGVTLHYPQETGSLCGVGTGPPGSITCYIPGHVTGSPDGQTYSAGFYSIGWCLPPPTSSSPPLPPPPPIVTGASCTHAPPSTWYDLDAPVGSAAPTWAGPNEGNMRIQDMPVNSIAPSWMPLAQNFASMTFKTLFVFEIFMIGLQGIFFRNDLAHFFSSFAFKTFIAVFFIYLTANAPTILPAVVNSFTTAGQAMHLSEYPSLPGVQPGKTELFDMYRQADDAAELFFCAAMASHINDRLTSLQYGNFPNLLVGKADISHFFNGAIGHITFEFLVQALGILVIAGAGIMSLSLTLYTVESYIAMFAGAFFLGFSSFRFTLPYTQGYLRYTIGVGVKLFTYWLLIAIESIVLMPVLQRAGSKLINAASIQFGEQPGQAQEFYLIPAAVDVSQILALAALTCFVPAILARFMCKDSNVQRVKQILQTASVFKSAALSAVTPAVVILPNSSHPAQDIRGMIGMPIQGSPIAAGIPVPPTPPTPYETFLVSTPTQISVTNQYVEAQYKHEAKNEENTPQKAPVVQASIADGPDPFERKQPSSPGFALESLRPGLSTKERKTLA